MENSYSTNETPINTSFEEATGEIRYNMTNDYMFRYILQSNEKVLRGLTCALLRLRPEQIQSIVIMNPIALAEDIQGKEFILDVKVMLNDNTVIALEMQVQDKGNWEDRSLVYLCRSFVRLSRGQDYAEALPVNQISFLDYTLFPEEPEFFATYKMMNVKTHRIYNEKFTLSVVDLTKIGLATEEDKEYELDHWAYLFKSRTWEEIKMYAEKNEYLKEAAKSVYIANEDEMVRERCFYREEAERYERTWKRDLDILKDKLAEKDEALTEKDEALAKKDDEIARLKEALQAAQEK